MHITHIAGIALPRPKGTVLPCWRLQAGEDKGVLNTPYPTICPSLGRPFRYSNSGEEIRGFQAGSRGGGMLRTDARRENPNGAGGGRIFSQVISAWTSAKISGSLRIASNAGQKPAEARRRPKRDRPTISCRFWLPVLQLIQLPVDAMQRQQFLVSAGFA
jgi:hypothetical protein